MPKQVKRYHWRRIWVSPTNYVQVRLYPEKIHMQEDFKQLCPKSSDHSHTLGVHVIYCKKQDGMNCNNSAEGRSGTVMLNLENIGAGIVAHEFGHAVLWAWDFVDKKEQYPLVLRTMEDEEEILHRQTRAVTEFYRWFWTIYQEKQVTPDRIKQRKKPAPFV